MAPAIAPTPVAQAGVTSTVINSAIINQWTPVAAPPQIRKRRYLFIRVLHPSSGSELGVPALEIALTILDMVHCRNLVTATKAIRKFIAYLELSR